tara:strand:- start:3210 stop:3383 length:174 start_codon:yes stop_codon:yes gene_type:complete
MKRSCLFSFRSESWGWDAPGGGDLTVLAQTHTTSAVEINMEWKAEQQTLTASAAESK